MIKLIKFCSLESFTLDADSGYECGAGYGFGKACASGSMVGGSTGYGIADDTIGYGLGRGDGEGEGDKIGEGYGSGTRVGRGSGKGNGGEN